MIYCRMAGRSFFKFDKSDWTYISALTLLIAAITLALCSCAVTPPIAYPKEARVTVLPVQKGDTGFYFATEDKDYLISNGVPAPWFQDTPRGWFLTKLQEERAADLIAAHRNNP